MQSRKNIVITGANSGVGFEALRALYREGHNIIFGARNTAKNQEVVKEISQKQGGSVIAFRLDLSARKSVQEFAKNVLSKFDHIDILDNNAGLIMNEKQINEQGIQMTLAINHFGHFYLTYLLWEAICKSKQARVINVSSRVHYNAPNNYLQDIQCQKKSWRSMEQYSTSKIYNILFTRGLNDLIAKHNLKHVKTASLHPGVVDSGFYQNSRLLKCFRCLCCCFFINNEEGARSTLHLCRVPFSEIRSGEYYDVDSRQVEMDRRGRSQDNVKKLWKMSEELYGIKFE